MFLVLFLLTVCHISVEWGWAGCSGTLVGSGARVVSLSLGGPLGKVSGRVWVRIGVICWEWGKSADAWIVGVWGYCRDVDGIEYGGKSTLYVAWFIYLVLLTTLQLALVGPKAAEGRAIHCRFHYKLVFPVELLTVFHCTRAHPFTSLRSVVGKEQPSQH